MEDWDTNAPFISRDPVPVILTYSTTDKSGSASTEQPLSPPIPLGETPKGKLYEDGNLLQRIQINSVLLRNELSTITGVSMQIMPIL